tara:strand:- start:20584 stop:21507 length:924 start_codon:yes stop_codon:yes gene_type:complete
MNMLANSKHPEVALALSQADAMTKLLSLGPRPLLTECLQRLDCPKDMLDPPAQDWVVKRIHLGNEFCERLLPTPSELSLLQQQAQQLELDFCLVTPMLTDAGFKRLDSLLPLLSEDTEVVINDWGTLQQVRADYPSLVPVLGRMLNKMIKDPRLPSEQWTQLHPHNSQSAHFRTLLERFGIKHLEMDVPPFARIEHFNSAPMALSVHFPYGYTVKGRMCRIGSLGQRDEAKFVAAHACNKECLNYWAKAERCGTKADAELDSFQRGNTQFYRHSAAMATAMWQAVDKRWIDRVIVAGDWHENHRTAE